MDHIRLGQYCESLCVDYLESKGYILKERNYRTASGEIDAISIDGNFLVFVEVKHIGKVGIEALYHQINRKKRSKILSVAKGYLFFHPEHNNLLIRFDVLGICVDSKGITHFENAFEENALL